MFSASIRMMSSLTRASLFGTRNSLQLQNMQNKTVSINPFNFVQRWIHATPSLSKLSFRNYWEMDQYLEVQKRPLKKKRRSKMWGCPQKKGIVTRLLIRKPMKPNSANRKCCKVRLSNGKEVIAFIPGEGHSLQEHNVVLVEGCRIKDLAHVHHRVIRGKYDCAHVIKK